MRYIPAQLCAVRFSSVIWEFQLEGLGGCWSNTPKLWKGEEQVAGLDEGVWLCGLEMLSWIDFWPRACGDGLWRALDGTSGEVTRGRRFLFWCLTFVSPHCISSGYPWSVPFLHAVLGGGGPKFAYLRWAVFWNSLLRCLMAMVRKSKLAHTAV